LYKTALALSLIALAANVAAGQGWTAEGPGLDRSEPANVKPRILDNVTIEQRLNEQIPLDLEFTDESGARVKLSRFFGDKPVVLALVYYNCPQVCNQILNGLVSSLRQVKFDAGKDFEVLAVSFDARETPGLASEKKDGYMHWYKREGGAAGWHFLTGEQQAIDALTEAVGFKYSYDPATDQFAHASGIMLLTPEGKLSRYFYGVEYAIKDVQLGLVEASNNRIGSVVDQLLLYCFHYDPASGKYGFLVINLIRLGGALTIIGLAVMLFVLRRRGPRKRRELSEGTI
jgi:protein SCO1/2